MMVALILAAQAAAVQPVSLDMFKPFVGSCWRADFSPKVWDTHCFDSMYGGAHVRDRHEVQDQGKTVYAGETIYSVDGPDLVFTYFNSLGGVGQGKVSSAEKLLSFKGTMRASPDKPEQVIDSEWRIVDGGHYEVCSLVKSSSGDIAPVLIFAKMAAAVGR